MRSRTPLLPQAGAAMGRSCSAGTSTTHCWSSDVATHELPVRHLWLSTGARASLPKTLSQQREPSPARRLLVAETEKDQHFLCKQLTLSASKSRPEFYAICERMLFIETQIKTPVHAFSEAVSQNQSKWESNQAEGRKNIQKVADICKQFKTFPKCLQCYNHGNGLDKNNTQRKNPTAGFTREVKKHIKCYIENWFMKGKRGRDNKKREKAKIQIIQRNQEDTRKKIKAHKIRNTF